jgi:hypothetical protein
MLFAPVFLYLLELSTALPIKCDSYAEQRLLQALECLFKQSNCGHNRGRRRRRYGHSPEPSPVVPQPSDIPEVPEPSDIPEVPDVGTLCQSDSDCGQGLICLFDDPPFEPEQIPAEPLAVCESDDDCAEGYTCYYEDTPVEPEETPDVPTPDDSGVIPITSGNVATITTFDDTVFECQEGPITEPALAVNPLLLGFTAEDYQQINNNGETPPWCGMTVSLTVNGKTFVGRVIDTCNPDSDAEGFPDPVTGEQIGTPCDYDDVLDIYDNEAGRAFLDDAIGDDFFQGPVIWSIY